ncbi:DNA alkylation repair protein [Carboxylicivirga sp. A043]|uniref:DNA alkylation repair protein n=1 Tax=Carboxylicivirga litoralis TaxID=2816963 RepID=UPI0021CB029E|nr:DNA alkylation repair protein [Carboxylicivirga sp. A043]MCU4155239.1 DNA alkylation repair protein [Carboxylicivirga sp. A043]
MRFFVENQKIEKEMSWVQAQLRLHMNGATTEQMERSGIDYRINYGVGIPHLKQLAKRIPVSFEVAERMWFSEVREMMLLAALIVPTENMTLDFCRDWAKQINNKDLVERTSMFLWTRVHNIENIILEWLAGENKHLLATAFYTVGRLLQTRADVKSINVSELVNALRSSEDLFIMKALSFALRMKLRHCPQEKEEIKAFAQSLNSSGEMNKQMLAEELFNELDFMANS